MAGTFTPIVSPGPGSGVEREYTIHEMKLGDGHSQRAPKGLNATRQKAKLIWSDLTPADALSIETELDGWAGVDWFLYAVPPWTITERWICKGVVRTAATQLGISLTANLERVFDTVATP